jgi:hypothetical protein
MPPRTREADSAAAPPGTRSRMGLLWGILKTVTLLFGVIIAVLLIIDSTLFANLLRKGEK